MTDPPAGPPEGWYPDPIVPGQERWWAGEQWSFEYTRPEPTALVPDDPALADAAGPRATPPASHGVEGDPDIVRLSDNTDGGFGRGASSDDRALPSQPRRIGAIGVLGIVAGLVVLHHVCRGVIRARARRRYRARPAAPAPEISP